MNEALEGTYETMSERIGYLLDAYGKNEENRAKVLRIFYKMVVFDESFDNALIDFLKQVIRNFVKQSADLPLEENKSLRDAIVEYERVSLEDFINICVLPDKAHPSKMVFIIAPLAMGVELVLINYTKYPKTTVEFYPRKEDAMRVVFPNPLEDDKEDDKRIHLLRSDMILYDVLYTIKEIDSFPSLLSYDKGIDVMPVVDPALILSVDCCSKNYYLPGYYRTMIKKTGLSKTCLNCGNILNEKRYEQLKKYRNRGSFYKGLITGGLTLLAYSVSMLFAVTHGLTN